MRSTREGHSRRGASVCIAAVFLLGVGTLAPSSADSQVRRFEAIGVVPVDPALERTAPARDRAIEAALREGVERVAADLLAEERMRKMADGEVPVGVNGSTGEGPEAQTGMGKEPGGGDDGAPVAGGGSPEEAAAELDAARAALGESMVQFTSRFRIMEDRGPQPALFLEDPEFDTEYHVVVEVQVDVERVRGKLVAAGLIRPPATALVQEGVRLEIRGPTPYAGYLALVELLVEDLGAQRVTPQEFGEDQIVLEVRTPNSGPQLLARMLDAAPPSLSIAPLEGTEKRIAVSLSYDSSFEDGPEGGADAPPARPRDSAAAPGDAGARSRNADTPGDAPTYRRW